MCNCAKPQNALKSVKHSEWQTRCSYSQDGTISKNPLLNCGKTKLVKGMDKLMTRITKSRTQKGIVFQCVWLSLCERHVHHHNTEVTPWLFSSESTVRKGSGPCFPCSPGTAVVECGN